MAKKACLQQIEDPKGSNIQKNCRNRHHLMRIEVSKDSYLEVFTRFSLNNSLWRLLLGGITCTSSPQIKHQHKKITRHRVIASQMIGRSLTQGRVIFLIFLGANTLPSCSWLINRPLKQLIYVGHPDDQSVDFICCIREMLGALFKLR